MLLITRPLAQTNNLESLLVANGIDYALFPAFEVKKFKPIAIKQKYDVIIFISVNAVNYAEEYFKEMFTTPFRVFAVGPVTANQLLKKNITVDCYPQKNASSKELLKMRECLDLSGNKILIVRGRGGSERLKVNLSTSNQVDYFEVYERVPCEATSLHRDSILSFINRPDGVLMATSNESLINIMRLVKIISADFIETLISKKIIVYSERLKDLAEDLGFKKIDITDNPSDEDLISQMINKK